MAEAWENAAEVIAPRRVFTFGVAGLLIFVGVAINFVGSPPKGSAGVPAHTPVPHTRDLRRRISSATAHAKAHGALLPLATTCDIVEDGHVQFVVHKLEEDAVRAKRSSPSSEHKTADIDPFDDEHRDPLLTIGDMGPNHVLMLNKYPVMADHVLVVTRKYEPQSGVLTGQDLEAWYAVVKHLPAMGFYNSAEEAGASQTHRHLQAVPLDAWKRLNPNPTAPAIPMEALIRPQAQGVTLSHTTQHQSEPFSVPRIGFPHRMLWLPTDPGPETLEHAYHRLLKALGRDVKGGMVQQPYNLVMTHDWVMMVPRAQRVYPGVDVNGLGYAGSLLAENEQALAVIKDIGPFRVLQGAATGV